MRYITAIIPLILLFLLDLVFIASFVLVFPMFLASDMQTSGDYPLSLSFAKKVW